MAYTRKKSAASDKIKQKAVLFGREYEFTIYPESKYMNKCSATGATIHRGMPIAMYVNDDGNKKYVFWPLPESVRAERKNPLENFKPDKYQAKVSKAIRETFHHIIVNASAGSGKTVTMCHAVMTERDILGPQAALVAFGSRDAERFNQLVGDKIDSMTTHSFGRIAVHNHFGKVKFKKNKLNDFLDVFVGVEKEHWPMRNAVKDLVGKAKAEALQPEDTSEITLLVASYGIEVEDSSVERAVVITSKILENSLDVEKYGYDFDDMIWLPVVLDLKLPHYDFVGIDEVQDFNECQLTIVKSLIDEGARVLAIGDPDQSLYAFRGARVDSFERVHAMLLDCENRETVELEMPICYRCPVESIKLAQTVVPRIQARPGAPLGEVIKNKTEAEMLETVCEGHTIICRTNAPLIRLAYRFIDMKKPMMILGGDQEANALIGVVLNLMGQNFAEASVSSFLDKLEDWFDNKKDSVKNQIQLETFKGRMDVLKIVCDHIVEMKDIITEIRRVFTPPADVSGRVVLSSIHKIKGGEADYIWHINPELCPHKKATTDEEKKQEKNAQFIAYTRNKIGYYEVPTVEQSKK